MLQVPDKPTKVGSEYIMASPDKKAAEWLNSLVAKSQDKITTIVDELTPARARVLLERNESNRKVREMTVSAYSRDMTNRSWDMNGEPFIIAKDGSMNDGQHRCLAVIKADVSIPAVFVVGVERETRNTLDQGVVRRLADYLVMNGHSYTNHLATAATFAWHYLQAGEIHGGQFKPTKSELLDLIDKYSNLSASIRFCERKGVAAVGGLSLIAFVHWVLKRQAVNKVDADQFITSLIDGTGPNWHLRNPILYARNRLVNERGKVRRHLKAELLFKAWNAWRRGESLKQLYLNGGKLPKLEK